jgi:hypothetical protein
MVSNTIDCYANIERKKKGKLKFIKISSSILTQLLWIAQLSKQNSNVKECI